MRVPVQRDSTASGVVGAKVALIKPGTNVTFSETVVGDKLEVTINASGGGGSTPGWNNAAVYLSTPGQFFFPMTGMDATLGKHLVVKNGLVLLVGPDYDYIVDEDGVWFNDPLVGDDTVVIYC